MNIVYIKCSECNNRVFSFSRHDMQYCKCGQCAIDGGFDYIKVTGTAETIRSTIKDSLSLIREQFIWTRRYDKNNTLLKEPERLLLKDLKTDHIVQILIGIMEKMSDGKHIVEAQWRAINIIFLEEIAFRYKTDKNYRPISSHL